MVGLRRPGRNSLAELALGGMPAAVGVDIGRVHTHGGVPEVAGSVLAIARHGAEEGVRDAI